MLSPQAIQVNVQDVLGNHLSRLAYLPLCNDCVHPERKPGGWGGEDRGGPEGGKSGGVERTGEDRRVGIGVGWGGQGRTEGWEEGWGGEDRGGPEGWGGEDRGELERVRGGVVISVARKIKERNNIE